MDVFGHSREVDGVPVHLMALLVYDITDARVVTYIVRVGDNADPFLTPPALRSLSVTAGHYYHAFLSNTKMRWMGEEYRFKDAQVKYFTDFLWGKASTPPPYNSSLLVVPYVRNMTAA